jgi:hypothetical protein
MQLFSTSSLTPKVRPHSPYVKQQRLLLRQSDISPLILSAWDRKDARLLRIGSG